MKDLKIGPDFAGFNLDDELRKEDAARKEAKKPAKNPAHMAFSVRIQEKTLAWIINGVVHEGDQYIVELLKDSLDNGARKHRTCGENIA